MKIDHNVLTQLNPTFGVAVLQNKPGAIKAIQSGNTSQGPDEEELVSAGYQWDNATKSYKKNDETIYYFEPGQTYVWVWGDSLFRALKQGDMLNKWVSGNAKYPNGKAKQFKITYSKMVGIPVPEEKPIDRMDSTGDAPEMDMPSGPVPSRANVGNPPSEADAIIAQIQKKYKVDPNAKLSKQAPIRMSSDEIIDLYKKAKALKATDPNGSAKLMTFIKTLQLLEENKIKKSQLTALISEIVKNITAEILKKKKVEEEGGAGASHGGMSVTANASPVNGPNAFKKKNIKEMTTTDGGTPGYQIPGAFAREGGSKAGVAGSAKLGYQLTPIGQKEMNRKGDKLK